jgi:DNA invertase Pin-like site-specific DNA recombinase
MSILRSLVSGTGSNSGACRSRLVVGEFEAWVEPRKHTVSNLTVRYHLVMTGQDGYQRPLRAVLYRRASTREQGDSGLGLAAQEEKLTAEALHRGWEIVANFHDVSSGRKTNGRYGLEQALAMLKRREADVLVCTRLDRLSRSVSDFARLMEQARREGWQFIALDLGVDTTTATGEMVANMLAALAQWERRLISERTKDALAVAKAAGKKLGHPSPLSLQTRRGVLSLRRRGLSAEQIAQRLNAEGVSTPSGRGRWHETMVRRIIERDHRSASSR